MVILVIAKLLLCSQKRKNYIMFKGGYQRQRVVSVAMNGHEQLGNPG